jgi:hypothetical protein
MTYKQTLIFLLRINNNYGLCDAQLKGLRNRNKVCNKNICIHDNI